MAQAALALVLGVWLLGGCTSSPKRPKAETPLQALNGENYQTPAPGIPEHVAVPARPKGHERPIVVQGKVMMSAGLGAVPIQGVEIGLFTEDGKLLGTAVSAAGGEFSLPAPVKSGRFKIKTMGGQYSGQYLVSIDNYPVAGVLLQVHKND